MHLDWVALLAALGVWTGVVGGGIGWMHKQGMRSRQALADSITALSLRMDTAHRTLSDRMTNEHNAVRAQIGDMIETTNQNYVPRREFDIALRGLEGSITNARKDIGVVGDSVDKMATRVDELFGKVEFRRTQR